MKKFYLTSEIINEDKDILKENGYTEEMFKTLSGEEIHKKANLVRIAKNSWSKYIDDYKRHNKYKKEMNKNE